MHLVTAQNDGTGVSVWNARTGAELLTLKGQARLNQVVSYSPDGTRIVTGSRDNSVRVWDARTGTELLSLKGHTGPVRSVGFSPDGSRVITGREDSTVRLGTRTQAPTSSRSRTT